MPTRSASRNVPVRGQPIAGPVSASTSSIVSPCSSIKRRRVEHHRYANPVGDKVRRVVGKHHLLAQHPVGKCGKRRDHSCIAFGRRNHFQ